MAKDKFGNRLGTQGAAINVAVEDAQPVATVQVVCKATGLNEARVKNHFKWLEKHGFGKQDGDGLRLVAPTTTPQVQAPQTIRIDPEVWLALQKKAVPFVETPNDVLRRLLGLGNR